MNREQLLTALDQAGETLKLMGEGSISLTWNKADHLIPSDRFCVTVHSRPYGPAIFGFGDSPRKALCHALANRSAKEADAAIEAEIRAEVEARLRDRAA